MTDAGVPKESVKETIISVIIAFALAFVFRSFVAEAFVIPTGSMAPTLNGAHMRFVSPTTGQDWAVSPWVFINNDQQNPYPSQARGLHDLSRGGMSAVEVHDPMTGETIRDAVGKARAGDRIFVLKYLYNVQEPDPFDVVVFKNVTQPEVNYIKRLIGLPGEQVALVDGDVFVRKGPAPALLPGETPNDWTAGDWQIRRKPARVQRAVWQLVYDSSYLTEAAVDKGVKSVWTAEGGLTTSDKGRSFSATAAGGTLLWDSSKPLLPRTNEYANRYPDYGAPDRTRAITDRYWYNENPTPNADDGRRFPVSDVRLRAGVKFPKGADASKLTLSATVTAQAHEFRALITGGTVTLQMRADRVEAWSDVAAGAMPALQGGDTTEVEFWHVDQSLQLWIDGKLVAHHEYDWKPMERLKAALTDDGWSKFETTLGPTGFGNPLKEPSGYKPVGVSWAVSGTPVELHRVGIDRDLFYRPDVYRDGPLVGRAAATTHPRSTLTLEKDQFFVCGDNSPMSQDARLWGYPAAWVAEEIDGSPSIVPRRMLMGKAFFVYFPAPTGDGVVPVPDFGRLRFIQ